MRVSYADDTPNQVSGATIPFGSKDGSILNRLKSPSLQGRG